jgi:hypothetical protein
MKIIIALINKEHKKNTYKDYLFVFVDNKNNLIETAYSYKRREDIVYCMFPFEYFELRHNLNIQEMSYIYNEDNSELMPNYVICKISTIPKKWED